MIRNIIAPTRSKARYAFWNENSDLLKPYKDCFRWIKVKCLGKLDMSHHFGDVERFKETCLYRDIPFAFQGMRICVDGTMGTIVGSNLSANLDVIFDGQTSPSNVHPHWKTVYYGENKKIVKDFNNI